MREAERVLNHLTSSMMTCEWAPGLPLAVKGFVTDRVFKE